MGHHPPFTGEERDPKKAKELNSFIQLTGAEYPLRPGTALCPKNRVLETESLFSYRFYICWGSLGNMMCIRSLWCPLTALNHTLELGCSRVLLVHGTDSISSQKCTRHLYFLSLDISWPTNSSEVCRELSPMDANSSQQRMGADG